MFRTSRTASTLAVTLLLTLGGAAHAEGTYEWVNAQMSTPSTLTRAEVRAQLQAPVAASVTTPAPAAPTVPAGAAVPVKSSTTQATATHGSPAL